MLQYDRKELGNLLREAREEAGLTQADVAKANGYTSPQFISNIERGISAAPLQLISKLTRMYKVDPSHVSSIIMKSQKKLLLKSLKAAA